MPTSARAPGGLSARFAGLAAEHPDRLALRFLHGEPEVSEWTYGALAGQADRVAAALAGHAAGERVLLLLPSGPDLVVALLGCLRAGLIAVPAPLSASGRPARHGERIAGLVADCTPTVAVVRSSTAVPDGLLPGGVEVVALDALPDGPAPDIGDPDPDAVVYLQYSSGSTGSPKAVRNTHRALLNQVDLLSAIWPGPDPVHVAGWLPLYHDMGMIQQLLLPLMTGGSTTFMAPASFAGDPARWLRAASTYRAGWLAGPDFAYQRCCDAVPADEVTGLDLSTVRYATDGAEPIRPATLARFAEHFAPAGLHADALTAGYGLAEAGLCVSTSRRPRGWRVSTYDAAALAAGVARAATDGRALVSCGNWFHDWDVRIVDPDTSRPVPELGVGVGVGVGVGEIWVSGDGMPDGYWNRPDETEATFRARLADGTGPWLRTGDLGFLDDGELYVCGRLKDLVIVHGANHHPNDLERTVEQGVAGMSVGGVCVTQRADGTVLVLAEADRRLPAERLAALAASVRDAVHAGHELTADEVVLVRRAALPKTTSGKIRRGAAAAAYAAGELAVLHVDTGLVASGSPVPAGGLLPVLYNSLCAVLGRTSVPVDAGFATLGLDSLTATRWAHQLSVLLGRAVPVTLLYTHPDLRRLTAALTPALPGLPTLSGWMAHMDGSTGRMCHSPTMPVAVIGVGLRLPGDITTLDGLAELLLGTRGVVGAPPAARARDGVPLTVPGAYLDAIDGFDAELFGIGGAEAQSMDPQQRLLLHAAWHALEDAGLAASSGAVREARVGVFVGQGHHDYSSLPLRLGHPEWVRAFHATGISMSAAAGRIAHVLGLRGPAMVVDTACSASLVAIDTACRHLADGTCDLALAGGVNVALSPETEQALLAAGMLSPGGRCATLSADADGYGRGEGAVLLVLKPLDAARRDGDRVLAVIRGSAVAQDGASSGLTVPNPTAQADVIRDAIAAAGLTPDDIDAVELHGTGTPLGDPIEVAALAEVHAGRTRPLYVGSVKTNLGHLEAAAGVAGVLRALVALRHQVWPGSPTLTSPNPRLADAALPYRFSDAPAPIPADTPLRRVGISSFGFTAPSATSSWRLPLPSTPRPTPAPPGSAGYRWPRPTRPPCVPGPPNSRTP